MITMEPALTQMPATAISRVDNLEFLSDVVPRTKTYRQIKEDKAREDEAAASRTISAGTRRANGDSGSKPIDQMIQKQNHVSNGHDPNSQDFTNSTSESLLPQNTLAQRPPFQNGHGHHQQAEDVEMSG